MDSSAIKELQKSSLIEQANKEIPSSIKDEIIALPSDFEIKSLAKFYPNRSRFTGSFSTNSVDGFAEYVTSHAQENNACFIDADAMSSKVIFNIGDTHTPGHCDDTAILALVKTAPFDVLLNINEKRLSQKSVAEFIEDWRAFITCEDQDGVNMPLPRALNAVRKITIESVAKQETVVGNFNAQSSAMESIDINSAEIPPTFINFTCSPYAGLPGRTFSLRLSIVTNDKTPALTLRIVNIEVHKEEMAQQFKDIVKSKLSNVTPAVNTFIGKFAI